MWPFLNVRVETPPKVSMLADEVMGKINSSDDFGHMHQSEPITVITSSPLTFDPASSQTGTPETLTLKENVLQFLDRAWVTVEHQSFG